MRGIAPGFRRALFVLFVVSEVHPFADGNGRVSRVMMNAELSHVAQSRIVIPNVFRNEYVASLRRASTENGNVEALARVLSYAWQWTAMMPWGDRAAAEGQLHATNALMDSSEAQQTGRRLELP
ncbi:MAG: Fic family protein [Acidimicrobiaceae bacterium]|nr:Fic family protein [Acidimicrobiaceae bacterium]MDE0497491.1 Fic family protein [Acidimicrobiaceae bacterium]